MPYISSLTVPIKPEKEIDIGKIKTCTNSNSRDSLVKLIHTVFSLIDFQNNISFITVKSSKIDRMKR
jgi:hypothetical protein